MHHLSRSEFLTLAAMFILIAYHLACLIWGRL